MREWMQGPGSIPAWFAARPGSGSLLVGVTVALALLAGYVQVLQHAVARGPVVLSAAPAARSAETAAGCNSLSTRNCSPAAGRLAAAEAAAVAQP